MGGFGSQVVESPQRKMFALALRKLGAGTPTISGLCANFCSIVDLGVGNYRIMVNDQAPSSQDLIAVAMPHTSGIVRLNIATSDELQIEVSCFAVDGTTPAELNFDLMVMGSHARDLIG